MGQAFLLTAAFLLGRHLDFLISVFTRKRGGEPFAPRDGTPGPRVYRKGGKMKPIARDEADEFAIEIRERESHARQ